MLDEEAQEILDQLRTTIIANFEEVYATPELTDDWSTININDVRLSRLRSEAREEGTILWFTLTAPMTIFDDDSSGHLELHVKTDIGLQIDEQLATVHPDGQPKVILKELLIDPHGIEDVIFPYQHHLLAVEKRIIIEGWPNLLAIPETLDGELTRFSKELQGLPSEVSRSYVRMLYFSAATITTLGIGDISPITAAARVAVSLEVILGIVLIGLFLNSLSQKRQQA